MRLQTPLTTVPPPSVRSGETGCAVIGVMTAKEVIQFVRDAMLMGVVIYAFTFGVHTAGTSVSMQIEHTPIAFIDKTALRRRGNSSNSFHEPWFKPYGVISGPREGRRLLDSGAVMAVLDIPPQFERSLLQGDQESIQLQLDSSNSSIAQIVEGYVRQTIAPVGIAYGLRSLNISPSSSSLPPGLIDVHRIWFNPNLTDSWFQSVSQLIQVITMLALLLPATAMVREKERGTIEQLTVSPLSPLQIILPKVISMTIVIIIGCCLSLFIVIVPIFHVPMKGSLPLFFFITAVYTFTMTGIGVFIASISRNHGTSGPPERYGAHSHDFPVRAVHAARGNAACAPAIHVCAADPLLSRHRFRDTAQGRGVADPVAGDS